MNPLNLWLLKILQRIFQIFIQYKRNQVIKKIKYYFKVSLKQKVLIIINYLNSIKNKSKIYLISKYKVIFKDQLSFGIKIKKDKIKKLKILEKSLNHKFYRKIKIRPNQILCKLLVDAI
jgi:hypothetical protein